MFILNRIRDSKLPYSIIMNNQFRDNLTNVYVPPKVNSSNRIMANIYDKTFSKLPFNRKNADNKPETTIKKNKTSEEITNFMHFEKAGYVSDSESDSDFDSYSDEESSQMPKYDEDVFTKACSNCVTSEKNVKNIACLLLYNAVNKGHDLVLSHCTLNSKINNFLTLCDFEWLRKIVITNNDIETINFDIFPEAIKEVVLKGNKIKNIKINHSYNYLESIDLSDNLLTNLHCLSYKYLPYLKKLNVSKNLLAGTLDNVFNLISFKMLYILDVSFNQLTSIEYINNDGSLYSIRCIYNNLRKISIMSTKLSNIEMSHNPKLQRIKLCTVGLINLAINGNLDYLDQSGICIFAKESCKIDTESQNAKFVGIGSPNVTLIDINENRFNRENNFTQNGRNIANNGRWTPNEFNNVVRNNFKHVSFNNKEKKHYRDYDGYNHNYERSHNLANENYPRYYKSTILTKENLDFFVKKTIEEFARQIKFSKDREFRNLLDSNFIYLGDETVV